MIDPTTILVIPKSCLSHFCDTSDKVAAHNGSSGVFEFVAMTDHVIHRGTCEIEGRKYTVNERAFHPTSSWARLEPITENIK